MLSTETFALGLQIFAALYANSKGFNAGFALLISMGMTFVYGLFLGHFLPNQILLATLLGAVLSRFVKLELVHIVLLYMVGWRVFKGVNVGKMLNF